MILADTSVWVDHLRRDDRTLAALLDGGMILTHPFVIGELSLGNLRRRELILDALSQLPQARAAEDSEVRSFMDAERLFGHGIGYIDAHLLAAVRLTPGATLWTKDRPLHGAAQRLGLAMPAPGKQ